MSKKALILKQQTGGLATDKKIGIANSFAAGQSIDFRKSPSQITPLSRTAREDSGVVSDLLYNSVMDNTGVIYSIGSTGKFYKRTTAGAWSSIGALPASAFGLLYRQDQNAIYMTHATTVSSYTPMNGTPVLQPNFYASSQSTYNNTTNTGFNVNADQSGSLLTTAIGTSYIEGNTTQLRYFQTDIEPLLKIGIYIVSKGTGNWTLVLHDGLNNQLGSVTVTNANLNVGWNYFTFSTPVRVAVAPAAQTYHIHITSTVADGTVSSSVTDDLSSCDLQVWANRLIQTNNGMHPMITFQQFICIGNANYLSVWENLGNAAPSNAEWQRHKLTFPPGYEVCGLAVFNEYLAIACERTTSSATSSAQAGIIFFWDGLSSTYNYFTEIPEGSPYAIHQYRNVIYYYAGGAWYAITSVTNQPEKIRTLPFGENSISNNNNATKIYPYAATVRNGIQLMAWPSVSTNTNIEYGVYSWGQVDINYPNSFGYSYLISTGSKTWSGSNNLSIGMVQNFGDVLLISWRDDLNGGYGVDSVTSSSKPAAYSYLRSLIYDDGYIGRDKEVEYVDATWDTIDNGVEIVISYSINRGAWVSSERFSNANQYLGEGVGYARLDALGSNGLKGRFRELQIGIEIYCDDTVTNSPAITSLNTVIDNLSEEVLQ